MPSSQVLQQITDSCCRINTYNLFLEIRCPVWIIEYKDSRIIILRGSTPRMKIVMSLRRAMIRSARVGLIWDVWPVWESFGGETLNSKVTTIEVRCWIPNK